MREENLPYQVFREFFSTFYVLIHHFYALSLYACALTRSLTHSQ